MNAVMDLFVIQLLMLSTYLGFYISVVWTPERICCSILYVLLLHFNLTLVCLSSEHSDRPDLQALAFFRPMSIKLKQVDRMSEKEADQWWVVEECSPVLTSSQHKCHSIEIVVFSDKVSPSSLGFLAGHG